METEKPLKVYVIKDDMNEGLTYRCLIMDKDINFNAELFQTRLDKIDRETITMDYDEIVRIVLDEYKEEYKDIHYIQNELSLYI